MVFICRNISGKTRALVTGIMFNIRVKDNLAKFAFNCWFCLEKRSVRPLGLDRSFAAQSPGFLRLFIGIVLIYCPVLH